MSYGHRHTQTQREKERERSKDVLSSGRKHLQKPVSEPNASRKIIGLSFPQMSEVELGLRDR